MPEWRRLLSIKRLTSRKRWSATSRLVSVPYDLIPALRKPDVSASTDHVTLEGPRITTTSFDRAMPDTAIGSPTCETSNGATESLDKHRMTNSAIESSDGETSDDAVESSDEDTSSILPDGAFTHQHASSFNQDTQWPIPDYSYVPTFDLPANWPLSENCAFQPYELSPFWKLPAELRNEIYMVLLCQLEPFELRASYYPWPQSKHIVDWAIAQTCSQIRSEALDVFYHVNTFVIDIDYLSTYKAPDDARALWRFDNARKWLERMGDANIRRLTRVTIDLGTFQFRTGGSEDNVDRIKRLLQTTKSEIQGLLIPPQALFLKAAYSNPYNAFGCRRLICCDLPFGDKPLARQIADSQLKDFRTRMVLSVFDDQVEKAIEAFGEGLQDIISSYGT